MGLFDFDKIVSAIDGLEKGLDTVITTTESSLEKGGKKLNDLSDKATTAVESAQKAVKSLSAEAESK